MKKAISVLLTVALVLTFSTPVYATQNREGIDVSEPPGVLFKYLFSNFSQEETEALSDKIAQEAEYKVVVVYDDIQTVLVCVKIGDNPQISNFSVFHKSVQKMVDITEQMAADMEGNVVLLSSDRLAGELALHIFGCMFMLAFEWTGMWEDFDANYHQFNSAELDLDEERVSQDLMNIIGFMINIVGLLIEK